MNSEASEGVVNTDQMDMLITSAGVDTVKSILDAFWKSNDEILVALTGQIAEGNFSDAAASAHALKGSAANLGAMQLAERARTIETACREQDIAMAAAALRKVGSDIDQTRVVFDNLLMAHAA